MKKIFGREASKGPVVYDDSFFKPKWFDGWEVLKPVLGELISLEPRWRNILDFGCGPGVLIDYMVERGYDYIGCDYSAEARELYLEYYGKNPERYITSLDECAGKDFDLLLTFDVFEHLRDDEITLLLEQTRDIPELFTNISREKRIAGHINIKSDRQWLKFFKRHGLVYREEKTVELRERYVELRPGTPDKWNENMFILARG